MEEKFIKECKKFINLLKDRKPSRDLTKYDADKWYESAFSTVARPLGNIKKKEEGYDNWKNKNYENLKQMILDVLKRLSPNGQISLSDEIQKIATACNVPFGVVQKILSVLIKYIVTNYYGDFDLKTLKEKYPWVADEDFVRKLPIPVDSIVLRNMKKEGSVFLIKVYTATATINGLPWSRIKKEDWLKLQEEISIFAAMQNLFPLYYEMIILWK